MPKKKTIPAPEDPVILGPNAEAAIETETISENAATAPEPAAGDSAGGPPDTDAPPALEGGEGFPPADTEPDTPPHGEALPEMESPGGKVDGTDTLEILSAETEPPALEGNTEAAPGPESESWMMAEGAEVPPADTGLAVAGAELSDAEVYAGAFSSDGSADEEDDPLPPYGEEASEVSGDAVAVPQNEVDTGETPRRRPRRRAQVTQAIAERERKNSRTGLPAEETEGTPTRPRFYDLDLNELDRGLTPEERKEWNAIYASYRGRNVITGTVAGMDRCAIHIRNRTTNKPVRQEMFCAVVIPFRVRILIPATEMWLGEPKPEYVLRNMSGATIEFVVIHVDREAGFAIASRRLAMRNRRYFFASQPALNEVNSRIKCRVLAVGPRRCLVECNGYDIDLTQREMRYTAIPDLRTEYHRGQELDCIVKSFDRRSDTLMVSVKETQPNPFDGARFRHPVMSRRQAVIAGKYAGGVFCNLPDGVVIMCSYSFQYEDSDFSIGDSVIVIIQKYDFGKKQIYGRIVAKW